MSTEKPSSPDNSEAEQASSSTEKASPIADRADRLLGAVAAKYQQFKVNRAHAYALEHLDQYDPVRVKQAEIYSTYDENLEASYERDKEFEKTYKREKRNYILRRIGSAAMWIPGIDVIGDMINESRSSRKIHKETRAQYVQKHGTYKNKLKTIWKSNDERNGRSKKILADMSDIVAADQKQWKKDD